MKRTLSLFLPDDQLWKLFLYGAKNSAGKATTTSPVIIAAEKIIHPAGRPEEIIMSENFSGVLKAVESKGYLTSVPMPDGLSLNQQITWQASRLYELKELPLGEGGEPAGLDVVKTCMIIGTATGVATLGILAHKEGYLTIFGLPKPPIVVTEAEKLILEDEIRTRILDNPPMTKEIVQNRTWFQFLGWTK